jgi:hypothetical protein
LRVAIKEGAVLARVDGEIAMFDRDVLIGEVQVAGGWKSKVIGI